MQRQQQEIAELRSEVSRQRALTTNISQMSVRLDSLSTSVTDRIAEVLQEQHRLDCILFRCALTVFFRVLVVVLSHPKTTLP